MINPVKDGRFRGSPRMKGGRFPLPKICDTCPTLMKRGTVMSCLSKMQNMYESRVTPFEFY